MYSYILCVGNIVRKRKLSSGWYPWSPSSVKKFIGNVLENTIIKSRNKIAAIIPHVGDVFPGV